MQFSFVIDINSFSIDRIGGTDSYIRRLTDVLKRNNHSVQIIKYNKIRWIMKTKPITNKINEVHKT